MTSPLKSPITNNKCLSTLKKIIPEKSIVHSFLLYDGNLEVELAKSKRFVVAHTNRYVNYEFWNCLMMDSERLGAIAGHFSPIENENIFDILQKEWPKYSDPFVRSSMFFLLNRNSNMSYASVGKLEPDERINPNIEKMKKFSCPDLHVMLDNEESFIDSIINIESECDYVFLPVGKFSFNLLDDGKNEGFEQTKVSHKSLRQLMAQTNKKIVLLYNYSDSVVKHYKEFNHYIVDQWGRHTESTKFAKEVLIANF